MEPGKTTTSPGNAGQARGGRTPVPTPPAVRLRRAAEPRRTPAGRGREHEVRRLILDLAALAAARRPGASAAAQASG
jgi:hypothetical protein